MIIAEAKIDQILYEVIVYAEFGKGKVSTGAYKVSEEGEDFYCISIKEMEEALEVGNDVPKDVSRPNQNEIILSFPTENQMIAVLAAFTNKSFEVIHNKWKAAQAKKEAK